MVSRMRVTSIRTKITLFVLLAVGILTALMVTIQFRTSLSRVESIEREQAIDDSESVIRQLDNTLADVGGTNSDWAWWDDTYQFVQDGNDEYRDSNLYAEAFTPIGIDMVAFVDTSGEVMYDGWFSDDLENPIPDDLLALAQPGGPLSAFDDDRQAALGDVVAADGYVFLATSRAILGSDLGGEPTGVLLMAREIDDDFVDDLAALTNLDLSIERCGEGGCDEPAGTARIATTSDVISTATVVDAIDGRPALEIGISSPRTIYQESLSGIQRVLLILIAVGLAAVIFTIAGIRRLIVDPLERLGSTVATVARTNDPSFRADVDTDDEIGVLAGGVNVMLARLQNSQQQLIEAKQQVEGASEAKSRFLSRVSHEVRTPINGVLAYAQLLQLDELDNDATASVEQIITAARHITQLVDEFLDVARIEAGTIPLATDIVSPIAVAGEVTNMVQALATKRSAPITIDGPADARVLADPLRLRQTLLNLVSNAIKYGDDQAPIDIVVRPLGEHVAIDVRDQGAGIPADHLARLFVPFDRLDADRSDQQGTGIGLSVSKQLVELMDGTIDVASEVGVGSTFTITLPGSDDSSGSMPQAIGTSSGC